MLETRSYPDTNSGCLSCMQAHCSIKVVDYKIEQTWSNLRATAGRPCNFRCSQSAPLDQLEPIVDGVDREKQPKISIPDNLRAVLLHGRPCRPGSAGKILAPFGWPHAH